MKNLNKKIDEYSEELFADLGLVSLAEEKKADLYARIQEHLHRVILETLKKVLNEGEISRIHNALEQEDYRTLNKLLKKYPQYKDILEERIETEFLNLKLIIAEEQKNAAPGTAEEGRETQTVN